MAIAADDPHRSERELPGLGIVEQIFEVIEHRLVEHGDGDDHRHHRRAQRDEGAVAREADERILDASRKRPLDRRALAIGCADEDEDRRADEREQDRRAEIGLATRSIRSASGRPAPCTSATDDRRRRPEQHPHSGDEGAVAWVRADPRGHREIGHVHRRIGGAEQQMRAEDARRPAQRPASSGGR